MSGRLEPKVITFLEGKEDDDAFRLSGGYELCNAVWKALAGTDPPWPKNPSQVPGESQRWRLSSPGGFLDFHATCNLLESVKGELSRSLARSVWLKLEESGIPCIFVSWREQEAKYEAAREVAEENIRQMYDEPAWSSFEGSDADFWARVSERNADEMDLRESLRDLYED